MKRLVLASQNKGKIEEIKAILKDLNIVVSSISDIISVDDVEESANNLEGNAFIKAKIAHDLIGGYVIADDTGLFVEALNGKPGVHTARYAGDFSSDTDNRIKLLSELEGKSNRKAYFETVIVLIDNNGESYYVKGVCKGEIAKEEKGFEGFGYDKIFIPEGYNKTFAELTLEEKNLISHRAKALNELRILLMDVLNESSNN